ncbi:sulfotransferase [Flavobacteriaceae bacterium]|nr:sulfotransferase [Flavobacteriaceae bacterium]
MEYTPVIIIGSGRSGTNMLRDIITSIDGFETWDCDEINPIWRYGNRDYPTDEIPINKLTPEIKKYIRRRFYGLYKRSKSKFIVEKTCANSLRLEYVFNIFPEAKFIIINRDGRDVTPSAMKRWGARFELKYTLKKLRYVPLTDLFYYLSKFGINRIKKIGLKSDSLSFWGPLYKGISEDVVKRSSIEICANQWKHCAENTLKQRVNISSENILDFQYESFVKNPINEMKRFSNFFKLSLSEENIKDLVSGVSDRSVGSYKKQFNSREIELLEEMTRPTLDKLNYNK